MSRSRTGRDYEPNLSESEESLGAEDGLRNDVDDDDDVGDDWVSVGEDVESHDEATPNPPIDIDLSSILCKAHALQLDPDCAKCKSVKAVVNPEIIKRIALAKSSSTSIPDATARMTTAQPKKKPTLLLAASALEYGKAMYFAVPLSKQQFDELDVHTCT